MKTHFVWRVGMAGLMLLAALAYGLAQPATALADDSAWLGEYYSNPSLIGAPTVTRSDGAISFNWSTGSPDARIPADGFSVRWTRNVYFDAGTYQFTTTTDDGVRLYVDGSLLIDQWHDQSATSYSAEITLSAGTHALRMEYYENQGTASAALSWSKVTTTRPVGNIITCVQPQNSWIMVYRWDGANWVDVNPHGYGPIAASGYLKLDGMYVDTGTFGGYGNPYWVQLWANGSLVTEVGNTGAGQPQFVVYPETDAYTPWSCPAP